MMSMNKIGNSEQNSEGISDQLQQVILNPIRNVLPDAMIEQIRKEIGYSFRRRKITLVVTVLHLVMSVTINEIQKSSDETAKIIRIIDKIAFQANLLTLNAAVEAGKGSASIGPAQHTDTYRQYLRKSTNCTSRSSSRKGG